MSRAVFDDDDRRFMKQALALARRGQGSTRPNPMVGAVIVSRGKVIARGWHRRAGGPHAEVAALNGVKGRAPGATMYVTLEPCCHTGRTGPCTEPVIASGIRRVVIGCVDQNPLVAGRGISRLRAAGVKVDTGCLQEESIALNRAFFRWIRDGRPHVTMKVAATLDGFIAEARPRRRGITWITGPAARAAAHELRARHDAILVGVGTVLADDPQLTIRDAGPRGRIAAASFLRVVLDGHLRTPPRARLLSPSAGPPPLLIAAQPRKDPSFAKRRAALERRGAEVLVLPGDADGRVPLRRVLQALAGRQVQALLVEGGSRVHGAFIAERLVDEVAIFFAPRLQGAGRPIAEGLGLPWTQPLGFGPLRVRHLGGDILLGADAAPGTTPRSRR